MRKLAKKNKAPELKFCQRLTLNMYMWRVFGPDKLTNLTGEIKRPHYEEIDEEGRTGFYKFWVRAYSSAERVVTDEQLSRYDGNVVRHLKKINEWRDVPLRLKYFQWLSLMFVEYYLDSYFNRRAELLYNLNAARAAFTGRHVSDFSNAVLPPYTEMELNKIALWNATGSGKTILMHINYLQYMHYAKLQAGANFILLTPKEGLSAQHIEDFRVSGIDAAIYDKSASRMHSGPNQIIVLENTKLEEKDGDKTVSVKRFGSRNVVFVDEGHRGSSSGKEGKWQKYRDELCSGGFSFEYSATFGQAADSTGDKELADRYAKCILFDYSYRFFYNDGYGKDYNILNLKEGGDEANRRIYLTACLLSFYQQKKLFADRAEEFADFNIENPLFVFVGSSVNVVRKENGRDVSDVLDILLFFKNFLDNKTVAVNDISRLISGQSGVDVFIKAFPYLIETGLTGEEVYADILKTVFNMKSTNAVLHIDNLKGISGEIQLRMGDNAPFGVINIGDDDKFLKLCKAKNFDTSSTNFSASLFQGITKPDSTISILIGAKKFTEGWNCWRVSTMGLMNVGRGEGSEIIQLFGRGVRLKGRGLSLKRSAEWQKDNHNVALPQHIKLLETFNVFGVRADYMKQFKEFLEREGVPSDNSGKPVTITLPVIKNLPARKLKTIQVKGGVNFKNDAPKPELKYDSRMGRVTLDTYAKVQFTSSGTLAANVTAKEENKIPANVIPLFDIDALWFELVRYKKEKGKNNIVVSRSAMLELLHRDDWYKLLISKGELDVRGYDDVKRFEKIALTLLEKYLDRYYYVEQNKWESGTVGYEYVELTDENFPAEYAVTTANEQFITWLNQIESALKDCKKRGKYVLPRNPTLYPLTILGGEMHLYNPLIYRADGDIQIEVSPVALNYNEKKFIEDLSKYVSNNNIGEVYLLRNQSRKGVGFFDNVGFYPDFILWIVQGDKQYITFIEPHSVMYEKITGEKVGLHKRIKNIQHELGAADKSLNVFILAPTLSVELQSECTEAEWNANNVLFMERRDYVQKLIDGIIGEMKSVN